MGVTSEPCRDPAPLRLTRALQTCSDRTVMSIAGHVSQPMLAHCSHVRIEAAERKALDVLAGGVKTKGYDTRNDTKPPSAAILPPQVIEGNGGDDGTRTRGLCRDRAAGLGFTMT